jgi:hypothetical protein
LKKVLLNLTRVNPPKGGGQAGWSDAEIPIYRENSKSQISNTKQITMTEIQNSKHAQDIEKRTYQICFGH